MERPGPLAKKPSTHASFPNVSRMIVSLRFVNNKVSGECGFLVCVGCCQGLCLRMSEQVGCKPWGHEMTSPLQVRQGREAQSRLPRLGSGGVESLAQPQALSCSSQNRARSAGAWTTAVTIGQAWPPNLCRPRQGIVTSRERLVATSGSGTWKRSRLHYEPDRLSDRRTMAEEGTDDPEAGLFTFI